MMKITLDKGFQMTFANGWTASVQFGPGNYCENRTYDFSDDYAAQQRAMGKLGCINAEIAAWDANDVWYDFGGDTVKGWINADEVSEFIAMIREQ